MSYILPWKCWYGNRYLKLDFPSDWDVKLFKMSGGNRLSDLEIKHAIQKPFGTLRLSEISRGKKNAVIAVDDLTRPTEAARIIPIIIDEITAAGMKKDQILIIMALGGHRTLTKFDLVRKLGKEIVDNLTVYNHSPFYNLISYGYSSRGTPVQINRFFVERDLKIGVGSIIPHRSAGFGGGSKIVVPGLAGANTIIKNHVPTLDGGSGNLLEIDRNENRADIDEIVKKVGLDFIVNQVSNEFGQAAKIFAGDPFEAHRIGIKSAHYIYKTPKPRELLDIAFVNAFPIDTELIQVVKALNIFRPGCEDIVKQDGSLVIIGACTEGRGFHHFSEYHSPLWSTIEKNLDIRKVIGNRNLIIFSPNVLKKDLLDFYPEGTFLCNSSQEVIKVLSKYHHKNTRVGLFPAGSLQILN